MRRSLLETIRADDISRYEHPTKERCVEYVVERLRDEFHFMSEREIAARVAVEYDRLGSLGSYAYWLMFTSKVLPDRTRVAIWNERHRSAIKKPTRVSFVTRCMKRLSCKGRRDEAIE